MASDADGHVVSSVSQARVGQALDVRVSDGVLACEVRGVTPEPYAPDGRADACRAPRRVRNHRTRALTAGRVY